MKAKTFIFHMLYFPGVFPLIFVSHITPTATTTCCCCTSSTTSASASAAATPTPTYRPFFCFPLRQRTRLTVTHHLAMLGQLSAAR